MKDVLQASLSAIAVLLFGLILTGCGLAPDEDNRWVKQTFHDLAYRVPRSWVPVRTEEMVKYSLKGTRMNQVRIQRFQQGDIHPGLRTPIDPSRNIFELAELSLKQLQNKVSYIDVTRQKQSRFPPLGQTSFQMKVKSTSSQAVDRMHWIVGAVIEDTYYRIVLEAEEFGHLSTVREDFLKFKTFLRIQKNEQTNGKPSSSKK